MSYRVQVRNQAMNVIAFHDCATFQEAIELAVEWYVDPVLAVEVVFNVPVPQDEQGTHEPIERG